MSGEHEDADGFEDEPVQIASKSMVGDLMGLVLEELRAAPAAWHNLSEDQRKAIADRAERRCGEAVGQVIACLGLGKDPAAFDDGTRPPLESPQGDLLGNDNPEGSRPSTVRGRPGGAT